MYKISHGDKVFLLHTFNDNYKINIPSFFFF